MPSLTAKIKGRLARLLKGQTPSRSLWHQLAELKNASAVLDLARRRAVFQPVEREAPAAKRILVLAPHPDDEAIGPGGTLALAKTRGCEIEVVYVTSTGFDGAEKRIGEARAACEKSGFGATFLPFVPGRIPLTTEAAGVLAETLERSRPDLLFLPFFLDDHDDHRRTLELLLAAAAKAAAPWRFEVWGYQVYSAAALPVVVDISAAAEAKRQAIATYASEMQKRNWAHYALGQNAAASRFLGSDSRERYAELFYVSDFAGYAELLERYFTDGPAYHGRYVDG